MNNDQLRLLGYRVEDMGAEYGRSFRGKFRWLNIRSGVFQDSECVSEQDAWSRARFHAQQQVASTTPAHA